MSGHPDRAHGAFLSENSRRIEHLAPSLPRDENEERRSYNLFCSEIGGFDFVRNGGKMRPWREREREEGKGGG